VQDSIASNFLDTSLVQKAAEMLELRLSKKGIAISISGIDGSGKTSLAQRLVQTLDASNVSVRYMHLHHWHTNIVVTPFLLLYNRHFARKVLVLDRCIYDNIAVATIRRRYPPRLLPLILILAIPCYPKFDYNFYLFTTFAETLRRRPNTCKKQFMALTEIYEQIALRRRCVRLQSDRNLSNTVLRVVSGRPAKRNSKAKNQV
jgi:thymidylate kinase